MGFYKRCAVFTVVTLSQIQSRALIAGTEQPKLIPPRSDTSTFIHKKHLSGVDSSYSRSEFSIAEFHLAKSGKADCIFYLGKIKTAHSLLHGVNAPNAVNKT